MRLPVTSITLDSSLNLTLCLQLLPSPCPLSHSTISPNLLSQFCSHHPGLKLLTFSRGFYNRHLVDLIPPSPFPLSLQPTPRTATMKLKKCNAIMTYPPHYPFKSFPLCCYSKALACKTPTICHCLPLCLHLPLLFPYFLSFNHTRFFIS